LQTLPDPLWGAGLRALTHYVAPLVLLWLAFFFGRTLRRGSMPLIEQIARRSNAALSPALCRYTRRLTLVWCVYFVGAAIASVAVLWSGDVAYGALNLAIWGGTLVLFVGERAIRPQLFPNEAFPGLLRQLHDTWSIWRAPNAKHGGSR